MTLGERRVVADCREHPKAKETGCTLVISGKESEVLDTAIYHATTKHGMKNEPGLRDQIRSMLKEEALAR